MQPPFTTIRKSLAEAGFITAGMMILAVLINLFHPNRIPYVAKAEYETMVPCPVQEGHVTAMDATEDILRQKGILFVDARDELEFEAWHYPGALRLTYDFLDPIPESELKQMASRIARERATRVMVYGDGADPDTGKLLGIDISASGIKNVGYIRGGASALRAAKPMSEKEVSP